MSSRFTRTLAASVDQLYTHANTLQITRVNVLSDLTHNRDNAAISNFVSQYISFGVSEGRSHC